MESKNKGGYNMKRLDKKTVKGFATGVLASLLVATTIAPAAASALREIRVAMGGIQIYVDGNLKKPTDVNGNVVEPMIYNGTTYLPVRAVTGMLTDKEVSWDGNKQIVYIGKKPESGGESVALDTLEKYDGWGAVKTGEQAQFKILGEVHTPFNALFGGNYFPDWVPLNVIYKLDSNYSKISGSLVVPYESLGSAAQQKLHIYNVDLYGNATLLDSYTAKAGDAPIKVETNISGCNFICISSVNPEIIQPGENQKIKNISDKGVFYDITLTTAE